MSSASPNTSALAAAVQRYPYLVSPAMLMRCWKGAKWEIAPHLAACNRVLMGTLGQGGGARIMVNVPYQHGKAIYGEEKVPTPLGWRRHGELRVGDQVYAPNGSPVNVLAVGPTEIQDCEVEFGDGSRIRCHERHEWPILARNGGGRKKNMETRRLEKLKLMSGTPSRSTYQVGPSGVLAGTFYEDAPIHPYALGVWLGNGTLGTPTICCGDDGVEVIEAVKECGYPVMSEWTHAGTGVHYSSFSLLWKALKASGLEHDKHVPERWLWASSWQREQLLTGLIDTDGSYSASSGQYRFTNTNSKLIEAVVELARSLGFRVGAVQEYPATTSSSGIVGKKDMFVVAFQAYKSLPCRLPRKISKQSGKLENRGVVAVRRVEPGFGNCIQVEGGQYLVGETLIPTHNSSLFSQAYPAWRLLHNPDLRVIVVGHGEEFATMQFGAEIKKIVEAFGPELGIRLRKDSKAKGEWKIDGHDGGVVCLGPDSGIVGRSSEIYVIDDLIRTREQAMSPVMMDKQWAFYQAAVYSRLRNMTDLIVVGTRWSRRDIFARIIDMARRTGEKWTHLKFTAIAKENDILGRKPGEALWPKMISLKMLQDARSEFGPYWNAAYQQEPEDEEGSHFKPRLWPRYLDLGNAYSLQTSPQRILLGKNETTIIVTVDWATTDKKYGDYTAIGVFALTPGGDLLILDYVNKRLRVEMCVPKLAEVCRKWRPHVVAVETHGFQATLANECRRFPEIPEPRRVRPENKSKLQRALPAITMGENGRIYLPSADDLATQQLESKGSGQDHWLEFLLTQLGAFTGIDDDHDDCVDCLSIASQLAFELRQFRGRQEEVPCVLSPGKEEFFA